MYVLFLLESNEATAEGSEVTAKPEEESEVAAVAQDDHRVRILFERCLIACALYEEFWTRVRAACFAPVINKATGQFWDFFFYRRHINK